MLFPYFDVYVPMEEQLEEQIEEAGAFPLVLLLIALVLLVLGFIFIRRKIKQNQSQSLPEEDHAPIESDEAE